MLLQFSVSNYRAFRQLATLNLAANSRDRSLPENVIASEAAGLGSRERQWLKGVALYGPNASGKSTLLDALHALQNLVVNSAKVTDPQEQIEPIKPFCLSYDDDQVPTAFAIAFVAEGSRFEYRVAATRQRLVHESLRAFASGKEQTWFQRDWSSEASDFVWKPERPTGFSRRKDIEVRTLPNMLYLSKSIAEGNRELNAVFRWFKDNLYFFDLGQEMHGGFTARQFAERTPLHRRIVKLLKHADLGVTGGRVVEQQPPEFGELLANFPPEIRERMKEGKWIKPELLHRGPNGAEVPLDWAYESDGTQRLYELAGPWLDILENGYTVCIDEVETSMHPLMVRELLRLFFSEKENSKGAQILFTTHNPLLLDPSLLRRDQVWFTDKDQDGVAHLYPLTDYQPRKGESLVRGYLAGRYGAVPFVPEGLLGSFPAHEVADRENNGE